MATRKQMPNMFEMKTKIKCYASYVAPKVPFDGILSPSRWGPRPLRRNAQPTFKSTNHDAITITQHATTTT